MAKCFFFHHIYAYDAKLRKKAVKRAEPGKPGEGQHKVAAMGGGGGEGAKIRSSSNRLVGIFYIWVF